MNTNTPDHATHTEVRRGSPPGPRGLAIILSRLHAATDYLGFLERTARRYGPIVQLDATTLLLAAPDLIEQVLVRNHRMYQKDYQELGEAQAYWGNGLAVNNSETWISHRRMIQAAFDPQAMDGYAQSMLAEGSVFSTNKALGESFDIYAALVDLTWTTAIRNFAGLRPGRLSDVLRSGVESTLTLLDNPVHLAVRFDTPEKEAFRAHLQQMKHELRAYIAEQRESGAVEPSLLRTLLTATDEHGRRMTDEQICDELVTMLRAGHKNSATVLSWAIDLLAKHPDVASRMLAEIQAVPEQTLATPDIERILPYTAAVISETMRLYPLYPIIGRTSNAETTLGGYTLAAGTSVIISAWLTQRNPDYFDAPDQFRPERWLGPQTHTLPRFAYFPFGGGPRLCTVRSYALMETMLLLASIMRRWKVQPTSRRVQPYDSFNGLRPKGGLPVRLETR